MILSNFAMQTLLLPPARFGATTLLLTRPPPPSSSSSLPRRTVFLQTNTTAIHSSPSHSPPFSSLSFLETRPSSHSSYLSYSAAFRGNRANTVAGHSSASASSSFSSTSDESDENKLAQVSENTSKYFKRLGSLGFWCQLVCTAVAAVILSFSVFITKRITSPAAFYATAGAIAAAFISVFWSFGYILLSERLRRTASDPAKAPTHAEVVNSLKNGIVVNLLGMGAAVLGMQATVGWLVAKVLASAVNPLYLGFSRGFSSVLALDVFLVQASANSILSHFLGLVFSLELLRSVTQPPPSEGIPFPGVA